MRTARVFFGRTFGRLAASSATACALAAFLAWTGFSLAWDFRAGGAAELPVFWARAVARALPVFVALLTMRVWTELRADGRLDALLVAPVKTGDLVRGAFAASMVWTLIALVLSLAVPWLVLPYLAPALRGRLTWSAFLPGFAAVALQGALWCAVSLAAGARCRSGATAALLSLVFTFFLPHGFLFAVLAAAPAWGARFAGPFFEVQAVHAATGLHSFFAPAVCLVPMLWALYATGRVLEDARATGRGGRGARRASFCARASAAVFCILLLACVGRLDRPFVLGGGAGGDAAFTPGLARTLADLRGDLHVTLFLSRTAPAYRGAERLLAGLAAQAGGVRVDVRTVDPRWNATEAARLLRANVPVGSIVFESGRRTWVPAAADGPVCEAALRRLIRPVRRATVGFVCGHGEASFEAYDEGKGMSDFARLLRVEGHRLRTVDLAAAPSVPADCDVLVVAGARTAFSRVELARLDAWLLHGGRLLVFATPDPQAGVSPLLPAWGVAVRPFTAVSPRAFGGRTLTGDDVVAVDFAPHRIMAPLAGASLVFGEAAVLEPVASTLGARVTPLVRTGPEAWGESDVAARPWTRDPTLEPGGPLVLAAALERGATASEELLRPSRIVVLGDALFALNGPLAARANANRAFLQNAFAWLAGQDPAYAAPSPAEAPAAGLTRRGRTVFALAAGLFAPFVCGLILFLHGKGRRRGA